MEDEEPGALFDGVVFTVIPSDTLHSREIEDLQAAIEGNGGQHIPLGETDQQIQDVGTLTHIISDHIDFPEYAKALEAGVYVVKPSWAAQSIRKRRQAGPRQHSPDPSQYFHDVVLSCADLPPGDVDAITSGVIAMGGQFSGPLTKLVTHIATMSLDNDKCRVAELKGLSCKIVLPHWFDDCFRLGKKISERPYTFPNPDLLKQERSPVKSYPSPQLEGAVTARPTSSLPRSPPPSPSKTRKSLNAFASKKVLLSSDLQLEDRLLTTLETLIKQGGGSITSDVHATDIYIGQYRDGSDYVAASQAGKEVANLAWLYHVINCNKYTSPQNKLLHYPIPRNGIAGFDNMKISVSNYSGDARVYLENLIKYSGAEYTKTMRQDNTHLITAHMQSEKCEAAQEWNINIVNHLWLEESYAKCAVQSLTNPRYTHFPMRTNLGEVAGRTVLDMKRLEHVCFPKLPRSPQKPSPRKKVAAPQVQIIQQQQVTPIGAKKPHLLHPNDDEASDDDREASPTLPVVKRPRGRPPKTATTPRVGDDEKENDVPARMSTGRTSKAKALDSLHKQASDIALFQKEMKRKGGVIHGKRHSEQLAEQSSPIARNPRKRPSDSYEVTAQGSDLSDGETQKQPTKQAKRAKQADASASLPPIQMRMMVTGDDRWQGKPSKESADRNKLRMLGVLLTQDPKNVQMLVAPKILRTKKFVAALACAPMVVDTAYLDAALTDDKLIEEPDLLQDLEAEDRLGFKLADALERAKQNKHRLFHGWSVFVTKDVTGGFDTYKDIITLNGGNAVLYTGRAGTVLPKRSVRMTSGTPSDSEEDSYDFVYLVAGITAAEVKLSKTFRDSAQKQGLEARVASTDWVLNAAMRQEITWDERWAQ